LRDHEMTIMVLSTTNETVYVN